MFLHIDILAILCYNSWAKLRKLNDNDSRLPPPAPREYPLRGKRELLFPTGTGSTSLTETCYPIPGC